MRALIDSNVIVDVLSCRFPFSEASAMVFMHAAAATVNMCISASQLTDIYYIMRKAIGREKSSEALRKLIRIFAIADNNEEDIIFASSSPIDDFEDAVLEASAFRNRCDFIVTRNVNDFKKSRVKVMTPDEFISMIEA